MRFSQKFRRSALPFLAGSALTLSTFAEQNSVSELVTVRENLSKALEYRDQAAKERSAWDLRKQEIENLLLIASEEKGNLEAELASSRPGLEELKNRETELETQREEEKTFADLLITSVPELAEELLQQARSWPPPLAAEKRSSLFKIQTLLENATPNDPGTIDTLLQETMQTLEAALAFQNEVHHSTAFHTLPDGREALVDVVYLGLASGYYYSKDLNLAGTISPAEEKWVWQPQAELADEIASFIAILNKEAPATWVSLPVNIQSKERAQ